MYVTFKTVCQDEMYFLKMNILFYTKYVRHFFSNINKNLKNDNINV